MHESDPKCKALVFTQFTSSMHYVMRQVSHALLLQMLICACSQLTEAGFQARTLEGSMTLKQRKQALVRMLTLLDVSLAECRTNSASIRRRQCSCSRCALALAA